MDNSIPHDDEFYQKYWMNLALYNIDKKRSAVNKIFKYDQILRAIYWLLFARFSVEEITNILKADINIIKTYQEQLKEIGAELGINFAMSLDKKTTGSFYINNPNSKERLEKLKVIDSVIRDNLKILNKNKELKAIWWLLFGGISKELIATLLKKDIEDIDNLEEELNNLLLHRNTSIMDDLLPEEAYENVFYLNFKAKYHTDYKDYKKHTSSDY